MDNDFCRALNEKLNPEERIFKFKSAELSGSILTVVFLVRSTDYDKFLDERLKKKVNDIASSIVPEDIGVIVRFSKAFADDTSVQNKIIEYVFREHKSVYPIFAAAKYNFESEGDFCTITITLEKYVCEYAKGINLAESLKDYLDTEFVEEIEVSFIETPNSETKEVVPEKFYVPTVRIIDAKPVKVYAKGSINQPKYILDVVEKNKEDTGLTLCGVISDIRSRVISKPTAKIKEKELFTFLLNDTTASVKCKFFANPRKDFSWSDVFVDNAKLIMGGNFKYDTFDNRFCFMASAVAEAEIDFSSINVESNFNVDYGRYMYVNPEPYNDVAQNNMFEVDLTDLDKFKNTTFVAFDLETTGLNVDSDEIIELAAIKIVDGHFTEKFSTFVKPSDHISAKITSITGIDDDMVADAPLPKQVIPDFYRFAKGCILVGHNIAGYDIPLLNTQARKVKYKFDNDFIDTLPLAKEKLRMSKFKLGDVCEKLDVPLIDAHRAINDVAANAKVFLKLMNMKKKD